MRLLRLPVFLPWAIACLGLVLVACPTGVWNANAAFPDTDGPWAVPLYRPISGGNRPTVWAELTSRRERRQFVARIPLTLDSGAWQSPLSDEVLEYLEVDGNTAR